MSYNGWSNRETWLVNLHFELNTKEDLIMAKDAIEEWLEEIGELSRFMQDYIDTSKINWYELEQALPSEVEE